MSEIENKLERIEGGGEDRPPYVFALPNYGCSPEGTEPVISYTLGGRRPTEDELIKAGMEAGWSEELSRAAAKKIVAKYPKAL